MVKYWHRGHVLIQVMGIEIMPFSAIHEYSWLEVNNNRNISLTFIAGLHGSLNTVCCGQPN